VTATEQARGRTHGAATVGDPPWRAVAGRELRDLWVTGRALPLMLAFTVLLSLTSYLVATNEELNFLEQRESVSLTLQVAVAVGGLLALLGAADSVSGERERGTLESLLLTPVSRRALVAGKGIAALSLWAGAYALAAPYVWYLARGVDVAAAALGAGLLVGTLLALFLVGLGLAVSCLAQSNRMSLSVTLFVLLALFAPTQMPSSAQNGWFGELLLRVDPSTAGLRVLGKVVIDGHTLGEELDWLVGPALAAVLACAAAYVVAGRLRLGAGDSS
jgi:ABC-2 type transport system permease protein